MRVRDSLTVASVATLLLLVVVGSAISLNCQPTHRASLEECTTRADVVFRGLVEAAYTSSEGPLVFRLLTTYKGDLLLHAQHVPSFGTNYRQITVRKAKDECEEVNWNMPDQVLFCLFANGTINIVASTPWSELAEERVWSSLGWSSWSDWFPCSASCGSGVQVRRRVCKSLSERSCFGEDAEERRCNMFDCNGVWSPLAAGERRARWSRVPGRSDARRIRPDAYVWLPATRRPFPDEFSLFVTMKVAQNSSRLGTVLSVRSRRQHEAYLSLEVADGVLQLVHATDGGKTEVVGIPVQVGDGGWHQVAVSIRAKESTVRAFGDCRWLRTDVLRRGAFQVPPDADLVIGYLFSGDVEQLTVAPDPNVADLQCSATAVPKNGRSPLECANSIMTRIRSEDCQSIAASTDDILWSDDDVTLAADMEPVWREELAAVRRLLDVEGGVASCPGCGLPFDTGKKRRLIDACGHERCYSCMFASDECPLCLPRTASSRPPRAPPPSRNRTDSMSQSCPVTPSDQHQVSQTHQPTPNSTTSASRRFFLSPRVLRNQFGAGSSRRRRDEPDGHVMSDDEGGGVRAASTRRGSHSDLYTRLGLLLGDGARRGRRTPAAASTHDSCSSLAAAGTANTSPVSTLTGGSAEEPRTTGRTASIRAVSHTTGSDSVGSLVSMSVSGHSNCSGSSRTRRSPPGRTPRRVCSRRTAAVMQENATTAEKLSLKPLYFEVPQLEPDPLFVGRSWLAADLERALGSSSCPGVLITGEAGTGKTALVLQLVERSCFGRRCIDLDAITVERETERNDDLDVEIDNEDALERLAGDVVAYHFCQADNNVTCLVAEFVHSLAAQLCQAPRLAAYKQHLLAEEETRATLTLDACLADPDTAFVRGILEPLTALRNSDTDADDTHEEEPEEGSTDDDGRNCIILIDALCEAEYHRPDAGDTIGSFLARHASKFPHWLKVVATVRTRLLEACAAVRFPYSRFSLDDGPTTRRDLLAYVARRASRSAALRSNAGLGSTTGNNGARTQRFARHMAGLARGSLLHAKLTLDLLERGQLVVKAASYGVLPVSLGQIYLLHFNLRFPTTRSYARVSDILAVCVSALRPLTALDIYKTLCAMKYSRPESWRDFTQRFRLLAGFLVRRQDDTHMFFHPSFREWLLTTGSNIEDGPGRFACDARSGHAAIAFKMSRADGPLDADASLELGHHILKAHVFRGSPQSRDLHAFWMADCALNASAALCSPRNVHAPNSRVSRLLLLAGAQPPPVDALTIFARAGRTPMLALLLEFGAQGRAEALAAAAGAGHADSVAMLLHAVPNEQDSDEENTALGALVAAASGGHARVIERIMREARAPPHPDAADSNANGDTALTAAAAGGHVDVTKTLLALGASPSALNARSEAPLIAAARMGHASLIELLTAGGGAPLEQRDSTGRTALIAAAAGGYAETVRQLLAAGAAVDATDHEGLTALCWACARGRVRAARVLITEGRADVAKADAAGRAPLDLAAANGSAPLVQMLLEAGAPLERADVHGLRALDRAAGCGSARALHCLLRRGARLGPATWTMAAGRPDIMLILLNKLLEDGNVLYRKGRLTEAAHRYQYALRKLPQPSEEESDCAEATAFRQLGLNLLLNQSRCKRKMGEATEAAELASRVVAARPNAYEPHYARSRALADMGRNSDALLDAERALELAPPDAGDVRRVLVRLRDDIAASLATENRLEI